MDEIAGLIKELVARIASFFDLFDLSFFISGGFSLLGLHYLFFILRADFPWPEGEVLSAVVAVLLAYVLGLLCFAAGRPARRFVQRSFEPRQTPFEAGGGAPGASAQPGQDLRGAYLAKLVTSHRLDRDELLKRYWEDDSGRKKAPSDAMDTIYPLMWAELRQSAPLAPSSRLLTAYWVRAAIYDGLIPALILWIAVLGRAWYDHLHGVGIPLVAGPGMLLLALGCLVCASEARRCDQYQADELAATLRWWLDQRARTAHAEGEAAKTPSGPSGT